jgi:hypothetical protein
MVVRKGRKQRHRVEIRAAQRVLLKLSHWHLPASGGAKTLF